VKRVLALALLAPMVCAAQSGSDPNLAHPNQVVTAQRDGYTIAGLVTHKEGVKAFKYGVLLFPGSPGVLRITEENGQIRHGQTGNFIIRSRRHWLDDETLLVSVDAPSDKWTFFPQIFRAEPRYGADVAALVSEVSKRYGGIGDWTFVGTSEGSITAFHAARMNPRLATRVILTSSVFTGTRNGPGLSGARLEDLKSPLLWVHHADDPCRFTQYSDARRYAESTKSPLVTVRGGGPQTGDACEPRTFHGYVGREAQTVKAMQAWVKTGQVPGDVTE
jgi:hypothetical protein